MSECHTIRSSMLLLIKASERVSRRSDPSMMRTTKEKETEGALNQVVISFREPHDSASRLSLTLAR